MAADEREGGQGTRQGGRGRAHARRPPRPDKESAILSAAREKANAAEQARDALQDRLTRLQSSKRDEPLKRSQLETMRVAVPDDPNLAQFILDANDAATKSGVDFLSISPTPPGAAGGATTGTTVAGGAAGPVSIKLAISITGGYFQVIDFLNRLNGLPRIVVIDSLSLSSSTSGQLTAAISARMFVGSAAPVSAGATTTTVAGATTTTVAGATTTTRPAGAP